MNLLQTVWYDDYDERDEIKSEHADKAWHLYIMLCVDDIQRQAMLKMYNLTLTSFITIHFCC